MSRKTCLNRKHLNQAMSKGRDRAQAIAILTGSGVVKGADGNIVTAPRKKPFNIAK